MGWGLWGWEAPAELAAVPGVEAAPGYEGVGKGSGMGRWVDGAAPQSSLWGGREESQLSSFLLPLPPALQHKRRDLLDLTAVQRLVDGCGVHTAPLNSRRA